LSGRSRVTLFINQIYRKIIINIKQYSWRLRQVQSLRNGKGINDSD
jgi:hypothetical protein